MTTLRQAVRKHLVEEATIYGLVGEKVSSAYIPRYQNQLPFVIFSVISNFDEAETHNGISGLRKARVQFTVIGATPDETQAVADAIRATFVELSRRPLATRLLGGVIPVGRVVQTAEFDNIDIEIQGYTLVADWIFYYTE